MNALCKLRHELRWLLTLSQGYGSLSRCSGYNFNPARGHSLTLSSQGTWALVRHLRAPSPPPSDLARSPLLHLEAPGPQFPFPCLCLGSHGLSGKCLEKKATPNPKLTSAGLHPFPHGGLMNFNSLFLSPVYSEPMTNPRFFWLFC